MDKLQVYSHDQMLLIVAKATLVASLTVKQVHISLMEDAAGLFLIWLEKTEGAGINYYICRVIP